MKLKPTFVAVLVAVVLLTLAGVAGAQETLCNVTAEWQVPPTGATPTGYVIEVYENSDLEPAVSDTLGPVTTHTGGYAPGDTLKCRVNAFIPLGRLQVRDPDTGELTWRETTEKWFGGWSEFSLLYVCGPGIPGICGPPEWSDRFPVTITFINNGVFNGPAVEINNPE